MKLGEDMKVNSGVKQIVEMLVKLEPQEFIGVCKILGVKIYDDVEGAESKEDSVEVRPADILISEAIDKIVLLNRTQRRNLRRLLKPAVKGR